jgi:hypothetical protein
MITHAFINIFFATNLPIDMELLLTQPMQDTYLALINLKNHIKSI